jgi:hypothetical protein
MSSDSELRYFDALKRIASYTPPDRMRSDNSRGQGYGLEPSEEVDMAYENVIQEAKNAIKGRRRPALSPPQDKGGV